MIWEKALCNFLLIILNHILQRFLHTLLPLATTIAPPPPSRSAPILSAGFSYPQSGGWQWQIEEHHRSISTRLEGQIITGYFSSSSQKPWLFMWDCKIYESLHSMMLYVTLWITDCKLRSMSGGRISTWLHPHIISLIKSSLEGLEPNTGFFFYKTSNNVHLIAQTLLLGEVKYFALRVRFFSSKCLPHFKYYNFMGIVKTLLFVL